MQRKYLISRQDVLCISRYSSPENIIKSCQKSSAYAAKKESCKLKVSAFEKLFLIFLV